MRELRFLLVGLVLVAGLGYGGAKAYIYYKVSDGVDTALAMASPYAQVEYSGVSSTLTGELTIDDVKLRLNRYRDEISIGSLGIKTDNFITLLKLADMSAQNGPGDGGMPDSFGFIARDIRVAASSDYYRDLYEQNIKTINPPDIRQRGVQCVGKYGFSPKTLEKLGYEEMVMSTSVIFRQEDDHFVTDMTFNIAEMTDVEMTVAIGGNAMAGAVMGGTYSPSLHNFELKVTDRSLNQRVVKYCTDLGLTPAQITAAQLRSLQYFGNTLGITFDEYVIDPYKEFIAGKSTFIATARPRAPLELASIDNYKSSDVPALLNLEAVAR